MNSRKVKIGEKMAILKDGDKVGLVCLSNGLAKEMEENIQCLCNVLQEIGLQPICSPYLYKTTSVSSAEPNQRVKVLMDFYQAEEIKAIFDISGGDIANEVLTYLDYKIIKDKNKPFFGYSDLTTVINALYSQTGRSSYLYQIRNVIGSDSDKQQSYIRQSLLEDKPGLLDFSYTFLQGNSLEGIVVGGNIRCLLKLAGTKFMPDCTGKILFLESRSGGVAQMITFLNQYKQMGILDQINGLILGSFSEMEEKKLIPSIEELVIRVLGERKIPIVKTREIGHGQDSKAIIIGQSIKLRTYESSQ